MCTSTLETPNTNGNAFAERMLNAVNEASLMLMTSIGHRTGLFDRLAEMSPATSEQIATRCELNERYVREWLGAMVTGRIVEYNPATKKYHLPAEHAACLTREAGTDNIASVAQWIAVLGAVEDEVTAAFEHGRGVPYSSYKRFHEVMASESALTVVAALDDHILPLIPGIQAQLEQGINVADLGCGSGLALMHLAERFPKSQFTGLDFSIEAISNARGIAEKRGLRNVQFHVQDAAKWKLKHELDLIFTFDAIHDQARPDLVLENIRQALRPGGVYLMQDIAASSHVDKNIDRPLGPTLYTISCMHCMSVSLASGGMGLGAAWGKEKALEMLAEAGFENVRVEQLEHDILNYYYVCQV
ncbi:MAG: class I SAM-dependent methyltransferase [Bythopirellula sp.]|nr:class I SAM-dependent methyltransferase [Bythopirellula sp.]